MYYNFFFFFISDCLCDPEGSASESCDPVNGICDQCRPHVIGPKCNECEEGYYGFPDCQRMYNIMPVYPLNDSYRLFDSFFCEWSVI